MKHVGGVPDAWHAQTEWEVDASYASGFAAGYARAVEDVARQIEEATGRKAGTPEETIRWLVRAWDWPRPGGEHHRGPYGVDQQRGT